MATEEQRITRLEQAFVTITELFQNMDSRLDRHESGIDELHAAQANSEAKIAALADAQIRTEEALTRLADAQTRTEEVLRRLLEGRNDQA